MVNFMENQDKKTHNKKTLNTCDKEEEKQHNIKNFNSDPKKKIEKLKLQLLQNQKKINNITLRKLADIENIKKNTEIEIKQIKIQAQLEFFKKIIPVIDSLEEVLNISSKLNLNNEPLIQGVELTLKSLFNWLNKLGVKVEDQHNKIFDPALHIPVLIESSDTKESKKIISIIKKGFIFNNTLLRKATVAIAKN